MAPQGRTTFSTNVESAVTAFCGRYRLKRNVIAAGIGVEESTFYNMLEAKQRWTRECLAALYHYVKPTSRAIAMQLARAILEDEELYLATEEQLLRDQLFALLSRAGRAFEDGEMEKQGLLDLSSEAIELAMKLKQKAKGK